MTARVPLMFNIIFEEGDFMSHTHSIPCAVLKNHRASEHIRKVQASRHRPRTNIQAKPNDLSKYLPLVVKNLMSRGMQINTWRTIYLYHPTWRERRRCGREEKKKTARAWGQKKPHLWLTSNVPYGDNHMGQAHGSSAGDLGDINISVPVLTTITGGGEDFIRRDCIRCSGKAKWQKRLLTYQHHPLLPCLAHQRNMFHGLSFWGTCGVKMRSSLEKLKRLILKRTRDNHRRTDVEK